MASNAAEHAEFIVLLAIHPEFAYAILSGEKRVEFRKTCIRRPFDTIALYATSPVRRVVGICRVVQVREASPATLWRQHAKSAGINRSRFMEYFNGSGRGVALVLDDVIPFDIPLPLSSFSHNLRVPQSFVYLSRAEFLASLTKDGSPSLCAQIGGGLPPVREAIRPVVGMNS